MFISSIVIIIGFVFLLRNLGLISGDVWPIIWPCLVIAFGLGILLRRRRRDSRWKKFCGGIKDFGEEIHKTFGEEDK